MKGSESSRRQRLLALACQAETVRTRGMRNRLAECRTRRLELLDEIRSLDSQAEQICCQEQRMSLVSRVRAGQLIQREQFLAVLVATKKEVAKFKRTLKVELRAIDDEMAAVCELIVKGDNKVDQLDRMRLRVASFLCSAKEISEREDVLAVKQYRRPAE